MTTEQQISVADAILGVRMAVSGSVGKEEDLFLFSCLIREWDKDNVLGMC